MICEHGTFTPTKAIRVPSKSLSLNQTEIFFYGFLTEILSSTGSYELNNWCEEFGTCCDNEDGLIANTACCACGGGYDYLERCVDNPTFIDCNSWKCSDFYNDWAWYNDVST